jgi:hypothetical protein
MSVFPLIRSVMVSFLLAILCSATVSAHAEDTWEITVEMTKSGIETMKIYPDLIKATVKKNGAAAPDDTLVLIERQTGDAQLLDPATSKVGDTATLKTKDGTASATVFMRSKSAAAFSARVVDASNATVKKADDLAMINTGGFEESSEKDCASKVQPNDILIPEKTVTRGNQTIKIPARTIPKDTRCRTGVWLYTGMVVDSFAAKELNDYINPEAADDLKTSFIAGVDVEQYIGGNSWIYLETVNGVRSTDVDCSGTNADDIPVCQENKGDNNAEFLYILRNARTLEAFLGVRKEFVPRSADANGRWYAKVQGGFIDVAGAGTDIVDNHIFLAGGYLSMDDRFGDSYVEVGFGKNDIFHSYENRRIKFDGFLTSGLGDSETTSWFLQMTVDSDFRKGPDSIQIYMGLDFDLRKLSLRMF